MMVMMMVMRLKVMGMGVMVGMRFMVNEMVMVMVVMMMVIVMMMISRATTLSFSTTRLTMVRLFQRIMIPRWMIGLIWLMTIMSTRQVTMIVSTRIMKQSILIPTRLAISSRKRIILIQSMKIIQSI